LYGAYLSQNNKIRLIGRSSQVHTIKKNALQIIGKTQLTTKVAATESIKTGDPLADLLILTVKSYDTLSAIQEAETLISDKTTVLSLQNGLDNIEKIEHIINRKQIIAGITTHGAYVEKPGIINHTGTGSTIIGELHGTITSRIQQIASIFNKSAIPTTISPEIIKELWSKAVINSSINPVTAVVKCKNGYLLQNPILEKIVEKICFESTAIANAYGIKLNHKNMINKTKQVITNTSENYSSMLQSLKKNKKTEIDSINGKLVKIGKSKNCDVHLNSILLSMLDS
ncbi:MAG: 2-dehydropantoate 2-reductase, partial [Thermoplasmatota archaeon]